MVVNFELKPSFCWTIIKGFKFTLFLLVNIYIFASVEIIATLSVDTDPPVFG